METSLYYMKLNDEKRENEGTSSPDDRALEPSRRTMETKAAGLLTACNWIEIRPNSHIWPETDGEQAQPREFLGCWRENCEDYVVVGPIAAVDGLTISISGQGQFNGTLFGMQKGNYFIVVSVEVVWVVLPRPWMPNGDIGGGRVRLDVGSEEKRGGGRKIKEIFKERKDVIPY
ncbi:hypothetical protein Tco_0491907 [Tanacetum coccineum]